MDRLYAPHRSEYHKNKQKECVFCKVQLNPNLQEEYIFYRDEICFFIMNKYPYNPGHFMIVPNRHIADYEKLNTKEITHLAKMSQKGVKILKEWGASGINLGFNLGIDSGAGIPQHIHFQLVPRFRSDANFITTISNTRVYSRDFNVVFNEIKEIAKGIL
jgi:diadenosine tetraphosphate (Ap4A) HIT family hydrolase